MNKLSRGFTLFEILIVVVIIGLLAVGLIAAIDPIESIRKSSDTNIQVNAQNLQNAMSLYYAREGVMPWSASSPCDANGGTSGTAPDGGDNSRVATAADTLNPCVTALITSGDLKASYLSSLSSNGMRLYMTGSTNVGYESRISICFQPQSKQFKKQTNSAVRAPVDAYAVAAPGTGTYWCAF